MKVSKLKIFKHTLSWLMIWLVQSLLFSGGSDLPFYLVKNIAIVSLQAAVVYINWAALSKVKWSESAPIIAYISGSVIIVYLAFSISFEVIDFISSIFFPDIVRIYQSNHTSWWPSGFWSILSGSAPYSIALLSSTIIHLIVLNKGHESTSEQEKLSELIENGSNTDFLTIKDGKTIHRLKKEEILYVEGLKEYVNWYTSGQKIITLHSLHKIDSTLSKEGFLRTHKSYIVNTSFVTTIKYNWLEISGKKIPIGRSYREKVSDYFQSDM